MNEINNKASKLNIVAAILMFICSGTYWVNVIISLLANMDDGKQINFGPVSGLFFLSGVFYAISSLAVAIMLATRAKNAVLNVGVFLFVITVLYGQIVQMVLNAREGITYPVYFFINILVSIQNILPFVAMIILITGTASKDVSRAIKFSRIWWLPGALNAVVYMTGIISTVIQSVRLMRMGDYVRKMVLETLSETIVSKVVGLIFGVALFLMGRWLAKSVDQIK